MRLPNLAFAAVAALALSGHPQSRTVQSLSAPKSAARAPVASDPDAQPIDGVAARIEDDVITESEVRELASFQQLVDGSAKSRGEIIQELADQWILRGEAKVANYPAPSKDDVDRAYAEFAKQFGTSQDFTKRCSALGLGEAAVRRMLEQQLYLSRFLDYRFRSAAQVTDAQIEAYYRDEFAAQLKAKGESVPPLASVEDTIREVLIQREISDGSAKWLDDARSRLRVDISPSEAQP